VKLIEYTKDTESFSNPAADEPTVIKKGTQRWVDDASAKSLCSNKRKRGGAVARLVDVKETVEADDEADDDEDEADDDEDEADEAEESQPDEGGTGGTGPASGGF
jgi:hypothetical protein